MPTLIDPIAAMNETANQSGSQPNDGAQSRTRSTSPMSAIGDGTCPIRLDGIYQFIEPVIATQRENFAKIIHGCCREMLEHDREIRRRSETLKKFDTKYRDKDDLDDQNRPKEKSYIPVSLRNKLSISCSPLVRNDGRCSQELAEIQTVQERARSIHEAYQASIAAELKKVAEIELSARRTLFAYSYSEAIVTIAEGIVIIAKNQAGRRPITMSVSDIAKVASIGAIRSIADRESNRWKESRFMLPGVGDGALDEFLKRHVAHHKITDATIANATARHSAEREISNYVIRKLEEWWPTLTHRLWAMDVKRDSDKKLESELADLFESKAIVKANDNLANAMETGADETVLPIIRQTVRRELAKKASTSKKAKRKKSLGGPKNQESTPKRSGPSKHEKSNDKSKKKLSTSNQASKKKSNNDGDKSATDDDKSAASSKSKKRGRSKSQPRSILKAPKVTFKKTRGRSPSKRNRGSSKSKLAADRGESSSGESSTEGNKN